MKRKLLLSLSILIVSGLAVGQGILPSPSLVAHQIVTYVGPGGNGSFTATQNVTTAYNLVVLVITCDLSNSGWSGVPCVGVSSPPKDQNNIVFEPIEFHYNTSYDWTEQEFYAVIPTSGTEVITFYPSVQCVPRDCTWVALVEQIQGVQADTLP